MATIRFPKRYVFLSAARSLLQHHSSDCVCKLVARSSSFAFIGRLRTIELVCVCGPGRCASRHTPIDGTHRGQGPPLTQAISPHLTPSLHLISPHLATVLPRCLFLIRPSGWPCTLPTAPPTALPATLLVTGTTQTKISSTHLRRRFRGAAPTEMQPAAKFATARAATMWAQLLRTPNPAITLPRAVQQLAAHHTAPRLRRLALHACLPSPRDEHSSPLCAHGPSTSRPLFQAGPLAPFFQAGPLAP